MEITKAKSTSTEVKVTDKIVDPNPLGEHIYLLKSDSKKHDLLLG